MSLATRFAILVACTCSIAACTTTTQGGLPYTPSASLVRENPALAVSVTAGKFTDQRGGDDKEWIGAIRNGWGIPAKNVDVAPSVSAAVQAAFAAGLRARGFATSGGTAYRVSGAIKRLDANQVVSLESNVEIEVDVFKVSTGQEVFSRTYSAHNLEGSLLSLHTAYFGSEQKLRALAQKTLDQVVNQALDDRALRDAIRS